MDKREIFTAKVRQLLVDAPSLRLRPFTSWEEELGIPKSTLQRWVTSGLAKPDKRSLPYLHKLKEHFQLPSVEWLWQVGEVEISDALRVVIMRAQAQVGEEHLIQYLSPLDQPALVRQEMAKVQEAGRWEEWKQEMGANNDEDARRIFAVVIANGWDAESILEELDEVADSQDST